MAPNPIPCADRFHNSYIVTSFGCWEWQHHLVRGYGRIKVSAGVYKMAHRFSYELFKKPIPAGLHIDHICKNTRCVNPCHLEAVTPHENLMRSSNFIAVNAHKTHCKRGHLLSGDNMRRSQKGYRVCRRCKFLMLRHYRRLKKENADTRA